MKIHSSSLNFPSAAINRQQSGKQSSAPKKEEKPESTSVNESSDSSKVLFSSPESAKIRKSLEDLSPNFDLSIQKNTGPLDAKISRALTAYRQELNNPFQDQRNCLIEGIDIYA